MKIFKFRGDFLGQCNTETCSSLCAIVDGNRSVRCAQWPDRLPPLGQRRVRIANVSRENLSKTRCSIPDGMPGPLSQTSSCRCSPSTLASIPICAAGPAYLTAFSSRLISTRSKSGPSTWISVNGAGSDKLIGAESPGSSICRALPTTSSSVNHSFLRLRPQTEFAPYPAGY